MLISLIFSFLYLAPKALLIGAAILPAILLLVYVYRHDRIEKEPRKLLLTLVLWGVVATFLAVAAESVGAIALAWFLPGGEDSCAGAPGARRSSTAASTRWCTRCSSRWASRCGKTSAT